MQPYNNFRELEQQVSILVGDFQKAIADGKPFSEVKRIYLKIKEIKVRMAQQKAVADN